ncbi:MAG TPA: SAM-dependent methyltransferase, partial [Quisquiliibacterium sp.]|nr:SAM-dependent methyltransferase [Quisquiliibacterium sp.]
MKEIEFPAPEPAAQQASDLLAARIAARIRDAGGWIGFDAFMNAALYEPGLGYYSGGAAKFGPAGDFVTAPEISPLFAACLATQCAQWFGHLPACIHEFGAGSGALAADLLLELARQGHDRVDYRIVEVSGELRERQRRTLAERAPALAARVQWLDRWPDEIEGVVLGNELLDALPARLFSLRSGRVFERGVGLEEDGERGAGVATGADCAGRSPGPRFAWRERPADAAFEAAVRARLAAPIAAAEGYWPDDYESEIGEQAQAWVLEAARRLRRGALLLVDYGFPAREFYHPQRRLGTLMCHYRHIAHGDPFRLPGLQDITVHVDFSAIAEAAAQGGLDLLGFTSQAALLFNLGLVEQLQRIPMEPASDYLRQTQGVKRLISEAEMGELF